MSDVCSDWVSADASPSALGDRYCVVDPGLAEALQTDHRQVFEAVARDTIAGAEALTRDVPNVGDAEVATLDDTGVVRVGTDVRPGDLLVGRVAPRGGGPLTPEEKLLRSIFGEQAGDVVDRSLRVPPGVFGTVSASGHVEPTGEGEVGRASVTVGWTRPLEVGDVLVDREGRRAVVAAIRPVLGGLAWADGGPVDVAKITLARDFLHARHIGPYSLVTQRPLSGRDNFGGQTVSRAQLAALVAGGAEWTAWELLTLKADCVEGRMWAYEQIVKGDHAGPEAPAVEAAAPDPGVFTFFAGPAARRAEDRVPATLPEGVQVAERELAALGLEVFTDGPPVRARWLTASQIRERSHGEVRKPETVNYRTHEAVPDGLFCERTFGPARDYECGCKKYKRMKHRGIVCEVCGVEVTRSRVRRERFGHLELAVPVPHPWRLAEIGAHLGLDADAVRSVVDGEADLSPDGRLAEATEAWSGPALQRQLEGTDLLLEALPVLPPDLRPLVPLDGGRWATSDLNDLYRRVINRNNRLKRLLDLDAPQPILRNEYAQVFAAIVALFDNGRTPRPIKGPGDRPLRSLAEVLTDHLGAGLLDKPCDFSGVAALVVDPELEADVCRIPLDVAAELFKPFAYGLLEAWGFTTTIKSSKKLVEKRDRVAMHAIRAVAERWPVLLATDRGLTGCRVTLGEGAAIAVAPALAEALNSEQVVLHLPIGRPACDEVRALQGTVQVVSAGQVQPSGWLTEVVGGTALVDVVDEALSHGDLVDDPTVRAGLGWWPGGEAPERSSWLDEVLQTAEAPTRPIDEGASALETWGPRSLSDLDVPDDVLARLHAAGLRTVADLVECTEVDLLKASIRRRPLLAIKGMLQDLGLSLRP